MYARQQRSPGVRPIRRQPRRARRHTPLLVRSAAAPVTDTSVPSVDQQNAQATPVLRQRRRASLRAAVRRVHTLRHRIIQVEQERDQALADTDELRLRLSRLATRLYTLEAERRAHPPTAHSDELEAIVEQLKRLQGAERHNQALEQELVRLRATVGALTLLAAPQTVAVPASPRPWYRRFWFALIGNDVRAAEWSASQHAR